MSAIKINSPESSEFVLDPAHAEQPYYGLAESVAASRCWPCEPVRTEWQDYNFFSGVLVYVGAQNGSDRPEAYQVLPKSLAVSLCRAYEDGHSPRTALEVFGSVVWSLQGWSQ